MCTSLLTVYGTPNIHHNEKYSYVKFHITLEYLMNS